MARAKKCEEEFNPWPPFVDVFSSVVLVLLLFILVLIVNVAYYTQFNSKIDAQAVTKAKKNNMQLGKDVSDMISLHKVEAPKLDAGGKGSLFKGGEGDGMKIVSKKQEKGQDVKKLSSSESLIAFNDSSMFIKSNVKSRVKSLVQSLYKKGKKVIITMAYPTTVISESMKKRITISRVVNIKNSLKKSGVKLNDIKIQIKKLEDKKYPNGYVKIRFE